MSILPKAVHRFNAIPSKFQWHYLKETHEKQKGKHEQVKRLIQKKFLKHRLEKTINSPTK